MGYHYTPFRIVNIKKDSYVSEIVEEMELLFITVRNVKSYNHFIAQYANFL